MAGKNEVPERLINYNIYGERNTLYGTATVELPEIEAMSETVTGAGIAGEIESPTLGHFGAMATTISWRTIERAAVELAAPGAHMVEIRGAQQVYDSASGAYNSVPVKVAMKIANKTFSLGSFEPGATTDTEQEFEVLYIKMWIGGKEVLEIDKLAYIAKFNGVDVLAKVRKDLGM